jgi:hypothetical protein
MISEAYTQEIGPKEQLKMHDTRKRKKTPAPDKLSLRDPVALSTCDPTAASQISAMLIPIVPIIRGFLLPTLSSRKTMKIKLKMGPTTL